MWNLYFLYRFSKENYVYDPLKNIGLDIVHISFQKGLILKYWKMSYAPIEDNFLFSDRREWSLKSGTYFMLSYFSSYSPDSIILTS